MSKVYNNENSMRNNFSKLYIKVESRRCNAQ